MVRWTSESTGMSVLRPIASEQLKDSFRKSRIWSTELEAWGFFGSDGGNERDAFLLWCSVSPGDRILLNLSGVLEVHTVVGIWKENSVGVSRWTFKMINPSGVLSDVEVEEQDLFKQAWGMLR